MVYKKKSKKIVYLLTIILFKYKSNMNYIKTTLENLKEKYPEFISFFTYYEVNWFKYLEDGSIDYTKVTKLQRCN
jgi:hypothetical protein